MSKKNSRRYDPEFKARVALEARLCGCVLSLTTDLSKSAQQPQRIPDRLRHGLRCEPKDDPPAGRLRISFRSRSAPSEAYIESLFEQEPPLRVVSIQATRKRMQRE